LRLKAFGVRGQFEAGLDEAGRGCLAGPVTAAAVILPENFYHPLLNDSKQLTEKEREVLKCVIEQKAISFAITHIRPEKIDEINILQASIYAMHLCVSSLEKKPEFLLVDGNRFNPYFGIPHTCIIKGDSKYASIAAASVLAKTARDEYMKCLDDKFPEYHWGSNKGYPTETHKKAIQIHGITKYHRKSFALGL
jgi:ribonuclease HII